MRLRSKSNIAGWDLYITDNNYDSYVENFIEDVAEEQIQSSKLIDNPYTYDRLKVFNRNYNILWLYNNKPIYGFFAVKYNKLPGNIIRNYTRMYKLNRHENKLNRSFLFQENKMYSIYFRDILKQNNIDTIFFTRHTATNKADLNKWKNKKRNEQFMQLDIKVAEDIKFRGINQTIYYYNAWQPEKRLDSSFIDVLKDV